MTDDMLERLALEVACPDCGAAAHEPCVVVEGRSARSLVDGGLLHWPRLPVQAPHHEPASRRTERRGPSCDKAHPSKRAFRGRAQAARALQRIRKRGERDDGGKPIRTYQCPSCGRWFLTSRPT